MMVAVIVSRISAVDRVSISAIGTVTAVRPVTPISGIALANRVAGNVTWSIAVAAALPGSPRGYAMSSRTVRLSQRLSGYGEQQARQNEDHFSRQTARHRTPAFLHIVAHRRPAGIESLRARRRKRRALFRRNLGGQPSGDTLLSFRRPARSEFVGCGRSVYTARSARQRGEAGQCLSSTSRGRSTTCCTRS